MQIDTKSLKLLCESKKLTDMPLTVVAFGQLAEITGSDFTIVAEDTEALKAALLEKFSALNEMKYAIAINRKIIQKNTKLNSTDTVALLPPFSGG